jgi:DNA processing protein
MYHTRQDMSRDLGWFSSSTAEDILAVGSLEPIGPITWQKLRHFFPSLNKLLSASSQNLAQAGLTDTQIQALKNRPTNLEAGQRLLKTKNIGLLTIDDSDYPALLKEISDPPLWLFYRGDKKVFKETCLTIVGTRKPSSYALSALEQILPSDIELCLVSGLAYGIDKAVHQLALKNNQPTIAVLAGGLDSIYPIDHHNLAEKIIESGGLLVSEYPPLTRPKPYRFPVRNRIIAGLSRVTVVVEAAIKSGSLTTAKSALDYNREVLAIPGDITRKLAEGTNFLIKHGALLVDSSRQIRELYGLKEITVDITVDKDTGRLLHLLIETPLSVDQLISATNQSIEQVLAELTQLELAGVIYQSQDGQYQINNTNLKNKKSK